MRYLLSVLGILGLVGCRAQTTAMTNPFMAPDRVPPPATRTLVPGTAQPYYPGDPVPNTPGALPGAVPQGNFPPVQPAPVQSSPYTPQPTGISPPGGWGGSSSYNGQPTNGQPTNVQPVSANLPLGGAVQIQPDQQGLRFGEASVYTQPVTPNLVTPNLVTPSPVTPQSAAAPWPAAYAGQPSPQTPQTQPQQLQPQWAYAQPAPLQPREVRIRAISSAAAEGSSSLSDGFRPQGSSLVRKPMLIERLAPRQRAQGAVESDRFGFDPEYAWLRGELLYDAANAQWLLQYVHSPSPANPTEPFGGSLVVRNPEVLGNLQPGEFVQLRGQLREPEWGADAPVYQVAVVQRQQI